MKTKIGFTGLSIVNLISIFLLAFIASSDVGCKSPEEYKPKFDSLMPPPDPPTLLAPPNDTGIVAYIPIDLTFDYTAVDGAEFYELEVSSDSTFASSEKFQCDYDSLATTWNSYGKYYWRVRASSHIWTWYTEWSDVWHFRVWPPVSKN